MNIDNLKKSLQYLKEYYLTAKMFNCPVINGLDELNNVILKLQKDLDSVTKLKETSDENQI